MEYRSISSNKASLKAYHKLLIHMKENSYLVKYDNLKIKYTEILSLFKGKTYERFAANLKILEFEINDPESNENTYRSCYKAIEKGYEEEIKIRDEHTITERQEDIENMMYNNYIL